MIAEPDRLPTRTARESLDAFHRALTSIVRSEPSDDLLSEDALLSRVQAMNAMIEAVPVGVVFAEAPSGRILMGNQRVEQLFGHPVLHSASVEAYGEWVAFHEDGRRVVAEEYPLSRVIRDGETFAELDIHYQRPDGSRLWLRVIGTPVFGPSGAMLGASVAVVDIEAERQLMQQQQLMIRELNHRVKNMFAVTRSIVSQSLRADGVDRDVAEKVVARLDSYAGAHSLILKGGDRVSLRQIVETSLAAFAGTHRLVVGGPDVLLKERHAVALAMALYELMTNATKYGALSSPNGVVTLRWTVEDERTLSIGWIEEGGPALATEGAVRKGFGSTIIDRALAMQTGGKVAIERPTSGLRWTLVADLVEAVRDGDGRAG